MEDREPKELKEVLVRVQQELKELPVLMVQQVLKVFQDLLVRVQQVLKELPVLMVHRVLKDM
jgi:hypothetical protein